MSRGGRGELSLGAASESRRRGPGRERQFGHGHRQVRGQQVRAAAGRTCRVNQHTGRKHVRTLVLSARCVHCYTCP